MPVLRSASGCGRPDCCVGDGATSETLDRRVVVIGFSLPLVFLIAAAALAHWLSAHDALVALAGLLGLGAGAVLAGRLSRRPPAPITTGLPVSVSTFSFRKECQ